MRTMFSAAALAAAVINNLFANWIAEPAGVAYAWTFAADSAEQKMFLGISRGDSGKAVTAAISGYQATYPCCRMPILCRTICIS